ncbi:MAG: VOC family protein [Gemmatimonadaceae bacterium]
MPSRYANAFGLSARLHHVGIAVRSIASMHPDLASTFDPIQKVRVAFVAMHDLTLELVEPVGEDSPVQRSLEEGVKLLHICYEVDRLEPALKSARSSGYAMIRAPAPAEAFDHRRIAWVYHRELGLVELLEREPANRSRAVTIAVATDPGAP